MYSFCLCFSNSVNVHVNASRTETDADQEEVETLSDYDSDGGKKSHSEQKSASMLSDDAVLQKKKLMNSLKLDQLSLCTEEEYLNKKKQSTLNRIRGAGLLLAPTEIDEIDHFFSCMASILRRLPERTRSKIKFKIHKIVHEAEIQALRPSSRTCVKPASTSGTTTRSSLSAGMGNYHFE